MGAQLSEEEIDLAFEALISPLGPRIAIAMKDLALAGLRADRERDERIAAGLRMLATLPKPDTPPAERRKGPPPEYDYCGTERRSGMERRKAEGELPEFGFRGAQADRRKGGSQKESSVKDIDRLVNRFLAWPLPKSVCSDTCASDPSYAFPRSGTNLLTAVEAKAMLEHVLAPTDPFPDSSAPSAEGQPGSAQNPTASASPEKRNHGGVNEGSIPSGRADSAPAELAERLRAYAKDWRTRAGNADICEEAADKIDALAAENAELKAERVGLLGGMKAWKETAESKDRSWAEVLGKKVEEAEAQIRHLVIKAAYVPGPMCRDCADRDGICYDGTKCDPFEAALDKLRALQPRKEQT